MLILKKDPPRGYILFTCSKPVAMANDGLVITSPAFPPEGNIPTTYTCDGPNYNPPLQVEGIPAGAHSLALVMDDPDAPDGSFVHWLVWNMEPVSTIAEDSRPGVEGRNSFGNTVYGGPCPPSGAHRYYFRVYALDAKLTLAAGAGKKILEEAMRPHVMAEGVLMGRYSREAG
jgi:Raf kinase inhibitor-like YbhB/YbcL family protein